MRPSGGEERLAQNEVYALHFCKKYASLRRCDKRKSRHKETLSPVLESAPTILTLLPAKRCGDRDIAKPSGFFCE